MPAATKLIVLITGANAGLGQAIVKTLCQSPTAHEILVGSRSVQKGEEAMPIIKAEVPSTTSSLSVIQVDFASDDSINNAASHVSAKYGKFDVPVNNAGVKFEAEVGPGIITMREAWNKTWDLNVSGTQIMTKAFMPLLLKSDDPRSIFIASGTACLTETEVTDSNPMLERINASLPAGWPKDAKTSRHPAYRSAKSGLNMMMREWRQVLRDDGIKIWAVAPGVFATRFTWLRGGGIEEDGCKGPFRGWQLHP